MSQGRPNAIICIETGKFYPSTRKASMASGADSSSITASCYAYKRGSSRPAGMYHWRYAQEDEYGDAEPAVIVDFPPDHVRCIETDIEWYNIRRASEMLLIPPNMLHDAIKYGGSIDGMHYTYIPKTVRGDECRQRDDTSVFKAGDKVRIKQVGEYVSRDLIGSVWQVTANVDGWADVKISNGDEIRYAEREILERIKSGPHGRSSQNLNQVKPRIKPRKKRNIGFAKPVRCVETGEVWKSTNKAAATIGTTSKRLGKYIRNSKPISGRNYEFTEID